MSNSGTDKERCEGQVWRLSTQVPPVSIRGCEKGWFMCPLLGITIRQRGTRIHRNRKSGPEYQRAVSSTSWIGCYDFLITNWRNEDVMSFNTICDQFIIHCRCLDNGVPTKYCLFFCFTQFVAAIILSNKIRNLESVKLIKDALPFNGAVIKWLNVL